MLFLASLIIPVVALAFLWLQDNVSGVGKLLGTGLMIATFVGPSLAGDNATGLLAQGGFWLAVRVGLALAFFFWAKLSDI